VLCCIFTCFTSPTDNPTKSLPITIFAFTILLGFRRNWFGERTSTAVMALGCLFGAFYSHNKYMRLYPTENPFLLIGYVQLGTFPAPASALCLAFSPE
jgi:hypothetical protein